jgi:hypothetical protein
MQKEAALKLDAAMRSVDEEDIALTRRRRKKLRAWLEEEEEAASVAEGRGREDRRA